MARPLRLQFADATYHVMSRGNAQQRIFVDDQDRHDFLKIMSAVGVRLRWRILAYCLMDNHYHLCLETPEPTLARGMRDLNSTYAQSFNRRHERVGHVLQGRYHAILVERSAHLLQLIRYIVLNPVRARLCGTAAAWRWSSHRAMVGTANAPPAVDVVRSRGYFTQAGGEPVAAYRRFIAEGTVADKSPTTSHPLILGSDSFVETVLARAAAGDLEVPRAQRARSLAHYARGARSRDEAIRRVHASGAYSLKAIGRHFGLHYSTISHICRTI